MTLVFHDPPNGPCYHEYLTKVFFKGLQQYLHAHGEPVHHGDVLDQIHNATVLTSADYLNAESIHLLKNHNCKIVGFSITDSSYISQSCREASEMSEVDLIFAATGLQKINEGHEFVVDHDFNVSLEKRQFLPEDDWIVFNNMRKMGRLQSLPYPHWSRLPDQPVRPYAQRSQKVIMRGGLHARRFILALFLMRQELLDVNSGFVTAPYFADSMRPEFRYCDPCRALFKANGGRFPLAGTHVSPAACNSSAKWGNHKDWCLDLGQWNNRCPASFYWLATQFRNHYGGYCDNAMLEKLVNAPWLTAEAHQELLGRITFTSDLKWLFSIYAAQRFWDAAAAGCVNVLPGRTADQDYFPQMEDGVHYLTYDEEMRFLDENVHATEEQYSRITQAASALYDQWIVPGRFALNENLCRHIINLIEQHAS